MLIPWNPFKEIEISVYLYPTNHKNQFINFCHTVMCSVFVFLSFVYIDYGKINQIRGHRCECYNIWVMGIFQQ